jgi:dATP pyrophosphohydrolase
MANDRFGNRIPINTNFVAVYVCRKAKGKSRYLILKRKSQYMHGLWGQVAGKIEEGETAAQAALRETKEETGLTPDKIYSVDVVESFYEADYNYISIIPVFVAFVPARAVVALSWEHREYKWVTPNQAKKLLPFIQQKRTIDIIEQEFILKKPLQNLRINL